MTDHRALIGRCPMFVSAELNMQARLLLADFDAAIAREQAPFENTAFAMSDGVNRP